MTEQEAYKGILKGYRIPVKEEKLALWESYKNEEEVQTLIEDRDN